MAKVYFVKFTDKLSGNVFYKFGHTQKSDALQRFSASYDERYGEFRIECVASITGDLAWCQQIETVFTSVYPKNFWLEDYLGGNRNWDGLSGITECVRLTDRQYARARDAFYNLKRAVQQAQQQAYETEREYEQ